MKAPKIQYEYHKQQKTSTFDVWYEDRPQFNDTLFGINILDYSVIIGSIKGYKDADVAKRAFDAINKMLAQDPEWVKDWREE